MGLMYIFKCERCGAGIAVLSAVEAHRVAWEGHPVCPACQEAERKADQAWAAIWRGIETVRHTGAQTPPAAPQDDTLPTPEQERAAAIEYLTQAIGEGYQPSNFRDELIRRPALLVSLSDEALQTEKGYAWNWYNLGGGLHETYEDPQPLRADDQVLAYKSPAEVQSGYDRLQHATALIRQLPRDHDGRNTWLMNYAAHHDADVQTMMRKYPQQFA